MSINSLQSTRSFQKGLQSKFCGVNRTSVTKLNLARHLFIPESTPSVCFASFASLTRIIRIVNKSDFLAHTNPIFKELYLLKLEDIRILQISQLMFTVRNNSSLITLKDMFTLNNQIHSYNTRSSK